ncbi:MAG: helix-turn-helix domain-containing protein [Kofleriaceae bacterium]
MTSWITAISVARIADTIGPQVARTLGLELAAVRFEDRIAVSHAIEIWERAIAATGRDLPVRAARYASCDERSTVAFVGANQPTFAAGLVKLVQLYPTASNAYGWQLERSDTELRLVCAPAGPIEHLGWQAQLEHELVDIASVATRLTEGAARPRALWLQHAPPPIVTAQITDQIGICPEVARPRYELTWPIAVATAPLIGARPHVANELERPLAQLLAAEEARRSMSERVRRLIAGSPVPRRWSVTELAELLGVSRRSLERALAAEHTSVVRILDREHRAAALAWLADLSIDEVSQRLGYSEPRAFARAFKRWTGKSPSAVRAALRDCS